MSGTDSGSAATRIPQVLWFALCRVVLGHRLLWYALTPTRCPVLTEAMLLRQLRQHLLRWPLLLRKTGTCLRASYALSGTDLGHALLSGYALAARCFGPDAATANYEAASQSLVLAFGIIKRGCCGGCCTERAYGATLHLY
eukprot:787420-Rhodomonas_salina.1